MCQTTFDAGLLAYVRMCCIPTIRGKTFVQNWFKNTFGLWSILKDLLNVHSIDLILNSGKYFWKENNKNMFYSPVSFCGDLSVWCRSLYKKQEKSCCRVFLVLWLWISFVNILGFWGLLLFWWWIFLPLSLGYGCFNFLHLVTHYTFLSHERLYSQWKCYQ